MIQFHSFTCSCPVFPTQFPEDTVFFPLYILVPFVKDELLTDVCAYLLALYSVQLIHMSVFMPISHCFDFYNFVVLFKVCKSYASCFVLSPQDCFGILILVWFCVNFKIICCSPVKNIMGNLIRITFIFLSISDMSLVISDTSSNFILIFL